MKKIWIIVLLCLLTTGILYGIYNTFAVNKIIIDGKTFILKYSNCEKGSQVCLNEYYLEKEYDNNWTELFTVIYAKDENDPLSVAKTMISGNSLSNMDYFSKQNIAMARFGVLFYTENRKPAIEQNVAKVMKYQYGDGVVSQQYARRYIFNKNDNISTHKANVRDFNSKYTDIVKDIPAQKIYNKPLQKW